MTSRLTDVYFDMDGVLSDLDGVLASEEGVAVADIRADRSLRASAIDRRRRRLETDHYTSLPALRVEDFKGLFAELAGDDVRVHILTACDADSPTDYAMAVAGKAMWLQDHFADCLSQISSVTVVPRGADKARYAGPTTVLIDDEPANTAAFRDAGGATIDYGTDFEACEIGLRMLQAR